MYSLSRHLRSSSASSLLFRCHSGGIKWISPFSSIFDGSFGESTEQKLPFPGNAGTSSSSLNSNGNISTPRSLNSPSFVDSAVGRDNQMGTYSRSMDFVKGIIEEDGRNNMGFSPFSRPTMETNADVVHIKLLRNNTFVTITDSKGNVKCKASSGSLPELKGGGKESGYAAEATAEHVGRRARDMGLKSVVVKVNGFSFFKKKRQGIMAFRDGYTESRADQNPIVYIEDTTRKAHNGCRLPRKRRV